MELENLFRILVVFTIVQRLLELVLAKVNESLLIRSGGLIVKETNYIFMVLLHTSWLLVLSYFAFFSPIVLEPVVATVALAFFLLGQTIRVVAIFTLGKKWSTRIMVRPGGKVVTKGIFKWIRHPNYVGVILEIAALPLFARLYVVALVFSILNLITLFLRLKKEEETLIKFSDYKDAFNLKTSND